MSPTESSFPGSDLHDQVVGLAVGQGELTFVNSVEGELAALAGELLAS